MSIIIRLCPSAYYQLNSYVPVLQLLLLLSFARPPLSTILYYHLLNRFLFDFFGIICFCF